jgi:ATP-dependent DNA helicase RecG
VTFDPLNILQRLQELDETVEIEAKAGSAAGEAAMTTVSAFSNEPGRHGGYIIFGVTKTSDDGDEKYDVVGVADPDKLTSDFVSQCTGMLSEAVRPDVETFADPSTRKVLVAAFIPEAADHQKPIFLKKLGLPKGAFRRISGHDVHCTLEDLEVLFRRTGTATYDETVVSESTFDDLDPEAFEAYRRMRSDRDASELDLSDLDLARSIAAVKSTGSTFTPTVAGIVLFGRRTALRRLFPMLRIEYIQVPSTVWAGHTEAGLNAIELLEGLLLAVPRVYQRVVGDIPRSFKLSNGSVVRDEAPLIPAGAIREAIVNAVMHRNYRTRQPTQIIRFSDRLEIRNPGVSLLPDDRLGEPGSITRNEKIAAVLHDTKLAENKGLGIPTMRTLVENAGLLPPSFRSDHGRDEFVATFGMQHFLDTDDLTWLSKFRSYSLADDQAKALVLVRRNGAISNSDYRTLNHVDTLMASQRLRELKQKGLLVKRGKGSGTTYGPGPAFAGARVQPRERTQSLSRLDRQTLLSGLPEDVLARIATLPKPTTGVALDELALNILAVKPLSGGQLGAILDRTSNAILRSVARLLRRGVIAPTQAEKWHPFQSYAVVVATKDIDRAAEQGNLLDMIK